MTDTAARAEALDEAQEVLLFEKETAETRSWIAEKMAVLNDADTGKVLRVVYAETDTLGIARRHRVLTCWLRLCRPLPRVRSVLAWRVANRSGCPWED